MSEYVIGADPGRRGAVVVLNAKDGSIVKMVPSKMVKESDVLDHRWLLENLREYQGKCVAVWMEDVHAIFGSSAGATFAFGDANGALRVTLDMIGGGSVDVQCVAPKVWQRTAWNGITPVASPKLGKDGAPIFLKNGAYKMDVNTKATSLIAAQSLFPGETFIPHRCRKPHDGIVDAALIAYYGWCHLRGTTVTPQKRGKGSCR